MNLSVLDASFVYLKRIHEQVMAILYIASKVTVLKYSLDARLF